ncbi:MAG: hypothetical protein P8J27_15425 [Mariniblastus sp.]|nr:hypothetical protein [Mariniblastus sp.]
MSDSDQEIEQETGPRFNKAIIGRLVGVGIFIALGTFAVIQTMDSNGNEENNETAVASKSAPLKSDVSQTGVEGIEPAKAATNKTSDGVKSGATTSSQFQTSPSAFGKNQIKLAQNTPSINAKIVKPTGTFNPALPAAKSSGSNDSKIPYVPLTPKTKPPERFAQAGGPPFGANNGFQALKTAEPNKSPIPNIKVPVQTTPGVSSKTATQTPGSNTAPLGKRPEKSTAQLAEDLLQKASDKAAANKKVAKGAGTITPPNQTRKSFAPPTVQSGFGSAPKTGFKPNVTAGGLGATRQPNIGGNFNSNSNSASRLAPINGSQSSTNLGGFKPQASSFESNQVFEPRQPVKTTPNPPSSLRNNSAPALSGLGQTPSPNKTRQSATSTSPFGNRSSQGSTLQKSAFPNNNVNQAAKTSSAPLSNNNRPTSRLNTIPMPTSSATASLTKNIPGERQLEGVRAPALIVEKISPQEIQVNTTADFQLIIKNVGRVSAEDVTVSDQIPNGTQFLGASPEPTLNQGSNLQWKIGKLRPGQEKRIKIQLKPIRHGEIGSVAQVTFATQASMRTLVTKPVLEILHQAQAIHLIGDDIKFDITVKNKGDGPATNVMIQQDVPKQLEFLDGSQGIEYEIGTLMPGQSRRIKLALKAAQIGKIQNVMFASADGGLQAKHELPLEVVAPNLVTKTDGPTIRHLQRNVSHKFSVSNNGTATATNVELVARLPSGLRFVSANNQGRYRQTDHSVFWSLAKLDRDVSASVELKTTPVEVGNQPIKFESFADLEVSSSVVQPLSVEHLVDVFFDIDDVIDPIEIGADTKYKVRVVNQGTKAATNVQLQVDFPQGLQPISIDGSIRHKINGQRISFEPINSMSPGDEINFVIHGKGTAQGDHRVKINMQTDGRQTPVSKEETTRVYSDR